MARRTGFSPFSGVDSRPADVVGRTRAALIMPPAPQRRSPSGAPQGDVPQPVLFPPTFMPPREALNFAGSGSASIVGTGVAPVSWTVPAGLVVTMPLASVGVITSFTVYISNMSVNTVAVYSLRINGAPVDGYGNYTLFPRPAASVAEVLFTTPVWVKVPRGGVISVNVSIGDAATYLVGASFTGWQYPESVEQQLAALGV